MYVNCPVSYKGVSNVQHNFNYYFDLLTNKVCNLFVWNNLPDTVDQRALNLTLILNGKVCWTEFDGKLYALGGNISGEPNAYYEPQFFIIANPILGSKQVKVRQKDGSNSLEGLDGILMGNSDVDLMSDRAVGGLFGLIYQYAGLLADNISSLNISQINGRVAQIWTADNDIQAKSAELILKDIYEGHPAKVVAQDILDKVGVLPAAQTGQTNTIMNLMEVHQFFLAQFYNELGIIANWNMKRERINTAESEMNGGPLDINIWNMKKNREEAVEQINEKFGTSITVELNPEIFYPESGNATLGLEENIEDLEGEQDPTIEVKEEDKKEENTAEVKIEEHREEVKGGDSE